MKKNTDRDAALWHRVFSAFSARTVREARLVYGSQGLGALRHYCAQWARGYCERHGLDPEAEAQIREEALKIALD